jgi:signal transduction histidine kinase
MLEIPIQYRLYVFLGFAAAMIYFLESLRGFIYLKTERSRLSLNFLSLCITTTLYSSLFWFGIAFKGALPVTHVKHLLWLFGVLTNLFYFETIVGYLDIEDRFSRFVTQISILGTAIFAFFELHYLVTGKSLLFESLSWQTQSYFQVMSGSNETTPTLLMKLLAAVFVGIFLMNSVYLLKKIFAHSKKEYLLKLGALVTILSVLNEIFNATRIVDSVSIMFLSKGIEILRVSEFFRRKHVEQAVYLQAQLSEVSKKAAAAFITSGLVHDIRGPLTVILGNLMRIQAVAIFLRKADAKTETKEFLKMSQDLDLVAEKFKGNVGRIQSMISSYLGLLKESNQVNSEPITLESLIKGALELSESRLHTANIRAVSVDAIPEVSISGVKAQLEMMFANIINNAVDAVKGVNQGWIKINFTTEATEVRISVVNSGIIPAAVIDQILKGEGVTSKGDLGYGIGLRIVAELCRAHRAQLNIYNRDHATHVEIRLPLLEPKIGRPAARVS